MERKIGLFSARAFSKRLRPPCEPIHGIVRVLQQIRTLFVSETVHK